MAKVAKPYQEGRGWCLRRRLLGQDLLVTGKKTAGEAKKAMNGIVEGLLERGRPKGLGPFKTTLAQGLQDMGIERLPFMKGAEQEVRRINRYLRAAGLATLRVRQWEPELQDAAGTSTADKKKQHFVVELVPARELRRVPQGLSTHRATLDKQTSVADKARDLLARMAVADIQTYHVQELMTALNSVRAPATLQLERALLRGFFNHASKVWCWSEPKQNPAAGLDMPTVDNGRERVMSADEQRRLDEAIHDCRNRHVGPMLTLLTETAMRSSEPLEYARWQDIDWDAKLLHLKDSKTDKRDVPLSPAALGALYALKALNPEARPDEHIVQMTYEALKAAWIRACARAGIKDLRVHDLRHTAATRMALKTGNVFIVQALTGHKTLSQLERYVNVKASDVVAVMHAPEPDPVPVGAATMAESVRAGDVVPEPAAVSVIEDTVGNLVRVNFGKRRAA